MKQFFLTVLGVFTGLFLFLVVLPVVLIMIVASAASGKPSTPANTVLELDLREGLTDQAPVDPFAAFGGGGLSTLQIVDTMAQAEKDKAVKALLIRLPEGGMTPAAADEVRQAVRRFRAAGKPVIAHSQGLMPVGAVISTYMVGASASELWFQNTASFGAVGLASDEIFLGGALRKYGVRADFEQRYEYKNAVNQLTETGFTEPHREAMTAWLNSVWTSAIANAAQDRKTTPQALRAALEAGPYSAEQALAAKLVDKIGQVEEAEAYAKKRAGKGAEIMEFADYADAKGQRVGSGSDAIAIIGGEGAILTGSGEGGGFGGGSEIHSDRIAEAFYEAIEDKSVKAIVFRVSSPGGSPDASEQILAALRAAKAAGKPVVVSMGDYAASGGYWISADASHIVAQPTTLTGSIGVFGGKFVLADALSRFGVEVEGLRVGGEYASAFGLDQGFSPAQRQAFAAQMDRTYDDFIRRVAAGRKLPEARVREIARGRIWSGVDAQRIGLVDELGGITEAIAAARRLARIPTDASVRFKRYPSPQSPFEALSELFGVQSEAARALVTIGAVMGDRDVQAVTERVRAERMRSQGSTVLADQPF